MLYKKLAECHPALKRNRVWCRQCGREQAVDSAHCFQHGWPQCCGKTMTIDSPNEQKEE